MLVFNPGSYNGQDSADQPAAFAPLHNDSVAFLGVELRCGFLHAVCLASNSACDGGMDSQAAGMLV
jgi:hypothetical protein